MRRIVVLGGGFGGLATAHELRRLRPDDEIIVVDRASHFMVGFRKTWILLGEEGPDAGRGALADLEQFGIQFRRGTVTEIQPAARAVAVDGERMEADAIVVALGARLAGDEIPGFEAHVLNLYDPGALQEARRKIDDFRGGRVSVGVYGLPYKCPPAPYEIAIMAGEFFRGRGVEAEIGVFTPLPMTLPIVGSAGCGIIESHLAAHGIGFLPEHHVTAVEAGAIIFGDRRLNYDLMLGIAPHRAPEVVVQSGLAQAGGWIAVDPRTLETDFPGVYAIGDVTSVMMGNGKPLPMAGVFAEAQGRVVAQRIAATFDGREAQATFTGEGGCFLEVGDGKAMVVEGQFMAQPGPQVALGGASVENLNEKKQFERERLLAWFGKAME